jgi:hypothetical protein
MDDDSGNCNGYGSDACSDGFGCGEDIGAVLGGGYGVGYGGWRYGDGFSSEEWRWTCDFALTALYRKPLAFFLLLWSKVIVLVAV